MIHFCSLRRPRRRIYLKENSGLSLYSINLHYDIDRILKQTWLLRLTFFIWTFPPISLKIDSVLRIELHSFLLQ